MSELTTQEILRMLPNFTAGLEVVASLPSSNKYLLQKIREEHLASGYTVIALEQTAGVGRAGKSWLACSGNLNLSMYWQFNEQNLLGLSLAVGVMLAQMLERQFNCPIQLKWPNDIYLGAKKLGGILVETLVVPAKQKVVLGVGINVLQAPQNTRPAVAICEFTEERVKLVDLAAASIIALEEGLREFTLDGFANFRPEWQRFDYLYGKKVKIFHIDESELIGIARGVTEQGYLLLEIDGKLCQIAAGTVSVI